MTDSPAALLEECARLLQAFDADSGSTPNEPEREAELMRELLRDGWTEAWAVTFAASPRLLRAIVGVLQQQETKGDKDLDTRVDSSSFTNSPAVTTAGKDTVVPPTVSDHQQSNEVGG